MPNMPGRHLQRRRRAARKIRMQAKTHRRRLGMAIFDRQIAYQPIRLQAEALRGQKRKRPQRIRRMVQPQHRLPPRRILHLPRLLPATAMDGMPVQQRRQFIRHPIPGELPPGHPPRKRKQRITAQQSRRILLQRAFPHWPQDRPRPLHPTGNRAANLRRQHQATIGGGQSDERGHGYQHQYGSAY